MTSEQRLEVLGDVGERLLEHLDKRCRVLGAAFDGGKALVGLQLGHPQRRAGLAPVRLGRRHPADRRL